MDIEKAITEGIVFKGGKSPSGKQEDKVKTKAKKKSYITGLSLIHIYISTGDVLRAEIKKGTELGKTAKGYIDQF